MKKDVIRNKKNPWTREIHHQAFLLYDMPGNRFYGVIQFIYQLYGNRDDAKSNLFLIQIQSTAPIKILDVQPCSFITHWFHPLIYYFSMISKCILNVVALQPRFLWKCQHRTDNSRVCLRWVVEGICRRWLNELMTLLILHDWESGQWESHQLTCALVVQLLALFNSFSPAAVFGVMIWISSIRQVHIIHIKLVGWSCVREMNHFS